MTGRREKNIAVFTELGRRLEGFGRNTASREAIERAVAENPWFTEPDILRAVGAICREMLDEVKIHAWLGSYPEAENKLDVGLITAGNIPLVGFFDLLCVLISGHNCLLSPSSKDKALTDYITGVIKDIDPNAGIFPLKIREPEILIATGSDNTRLYFSYRYGNIPTLLRGSRTSVAVLSGSESGGELEGLSSDIFSYCGLGCRNVSYLLLPEGYETDRLSEFLSARGKINPKYFNNFRQQRALLTMRGESFTEGEFFLLRETLQLPSAISEIGYRKYRDLNQVRLWLGENRNDIQCVVSHIRELEGRIPFGASQTPTLNDYADGVDTMDFLLRRSR